MATTATASFCLILAPVPSFALPQGGQVVEGSAQINQTTDTRLDVIQSTDKAIIDWRSFSIGANETTAFQQPSAQSLTLNRVTGSSASLILGNLVANGQIMLVNNNGILIGSGANIDVAGLVATTADISNRNFMAGDYVFDTPGNADASVVNYGDISVADQGLAALVAPGVANHGVIQARLGQVALASGNTFTLDFYGDRKIQLAVGDKVVGKAVTADGSQLDSLVENTGTITADGGRVLLTANAAKDVVDNVINMEGVIQAQTAELQGGEIVLSGGDAGSVRVAGTLDATGIDAGETGGSITVTGAQVALAETADLDASGEAGGGTVHVGGAYRGGGTTPTAQVTSVAAGASLKADATGNGDGGEVVVWADGTTGFKGAASARGGAEGGDGGLIEVSGHTLTLGGTVDVGAVAGTAGRILFDPTDLTVDTAAATTFVSALSSGGTVDVEASNSITVDAAIDSSAQSSTATLNFKDENGDSDLTVNLNATIALGANQDLTGEATTVNVTDGADIQNGIDVSVAGGTVNVAAGDYTPGSVAYDLAAFGGETVVSQILVDKALTLNGADGAVVHVGLPDSTDLADRTIGFTVAADDVTIDGFTIEGPLDGQTYDYRDVDFADYGYIYGIFVDENVKGSRITNNTMYDLRTGVTFEGDNGTSTSGQTTVATGNDISNTRGAYLLRSTGVTLSGNTFGDNNPDGITHNEWDLTLLGSLQDGDIFTSPFTSEAQYGTDMMALSAANNGMYIVDRRYGQGGTLVASNPAAADIANRSHVVVEAGANNDTSAGLGESRGNGYGHYRLPVATIKGGVDAVVNGGTVTVLGGTYVESTQIAVDKNLTLAGLAGDKAVITPGTDYNGKTAADAWFLVESGNTFNLSNVVINGEGYSVWQGIRSHGTLVVDNVDFRNLTTVGSGNDYMGLAIAAYGGTVAFGVGTDTHGSGGDASTVTVTDSTFENIGRVGILVKGTDATGTVSGNTYVGKGSGDHLDYAIEVSAGATATITGNTISAIHGVASDTWGSGGIYVHTAYTPDSVITTATVENNIIFDTSNAVIVGTDEDDRSVVTAKNNNFAGNDNGVQLMSTTATADFSGNWWGSTDDAVIAAYMDSDGFAGSVDFSTYLVSGTDTDATTAGFQGDFANLMVTTLGGQTGTTGRVQEGVDTVAAGGTVTLSDGIYALASTLTVTTGGITLTGESEDGVILDASAVSTYGVSIRELDGITLSNFTLRDAGTYGLKLYKLTDLTLQDVTVQGSGRSEVDLLGIDGATLTNITAKGQDTAGVGISLVDSHNVAMTGITTTGNQWGGIGIMTAGNNNVTGGSSNISLTGTNSLAETYGIYTETDYNAAASGGYYAITNLSLEGYDYTVQNSTFREASVGDSTEHTIYKQTEAEAIDLALALGTPDDSVVRKNSGSTYASIVAGTSAADGTFIVGTSGSSAMSIQAAVDAAADGDTISVNDGSYAAFGTSFGGAENLTIQASADSAVIDASGGVPGNGRIVDLRADGTTFDGFSIVGSGSAGVGVSVSGQGVTVSNNTITDTLTGIQTTTQYTAGNATLSGNTITSDYGISLQNTNNTVSGNTITAVAEGFSVKSGVNTATGNTITVSGGEAFALYDGAVASDLTLSSNTVTVAEGATLQNAVDLAGDSGSLTVGAGTYTGDIVISQANLTVTGSGSSQTIIRGVGTGESAAVKISADDVTLGGSGTEQGFQIVGAGKRAVYLDEGVSGATIQNNTVVAAENQVALETTGSQSGHTVQNNTFTAAGSGTTRQLVYINGAASLGAARASSDVDFLNNTFTGDAQLALGNEAAGSRIEGNTFSGDNSYATVELWGATESFTGNSFGTANGTHLVRSANANTGTVTYEAQADVLANNTFSNVALVRDAATTLSSGSVGIYGKVQSAVDAAAVNGTVDVVEGTFEEAVTLSTEGLTLVGSDESKIVVDGSTGRVDAVTITADNVTVQDLNIEGIADESYVTYAWNEINRGIVVRKGVEDFTIQDNSITNIRNGILIDGIDSTGSVTGNVIDNTKSAISVQYTDASGVTISGNSEGTYGNEWGLNLHLNGYWDGTSHNSNPIATVASADWQAALLALSTGNDGWSVQDQGYEQANRTHVNVAAGGSGNQGSQRAPLGSLQDGVDGLVDGGYLTVSAGTYGETVTVGRDVNLTTDGTIVLNGLTVDGDLTLRTDVAFDSSAVNGNLAFNGDVLGLTDEGQDLTLDAGDGDVAIRNVGTSTIGLGDVTVTAGNYYGSAGTSYVASMDVTGDGDVEVGTSTVNASGSVALSGSNVSGSVNATTATVTASTGTANVNVTATQTASVSGRNVQGSVSASTATVTATQNATVTVTATSNASVSGQNVTATVTAPTASVNATQTANVTANVNNLTASAGGGSVNNTGGKTTVSGNGVLAVNGKNETPGGENPNDESLNAGGTITVTFSSGPKSPAQAAFGGGSVQQPFATSYALGIGAGGGSGLAVAGEGGEGPETDTSGPDETLGFAGSFLGDFWSYYFAPEGGEGDTTGEENNNGV